MKEHRVGSMICAAIALAGLSHAQSIPRMPDGKPNMNGVWQHPYVSDMTKDAKDQKGAGELPFTPWGANDFKTYDPAKFDYTGHCLPFGLTRLVNTPMPMEIVQTPKKTVFLFEGFSSYIVIPTDGRKHTKDPDPTWYGESIGWYEGDTLVVDSIGFNEKTRLDTIGHGHSDQL